MSSRVRPTSAKTMSLFQSIVKRFLAAGALCFFKIVVESIIQIWLTLPLPPISCPSASLSSTHLNKHYFRCDCPPRDAHHSMTPAGVLLGGSSHPINMWVPFQRWVRPKSSKSVKCAVRGLSNRITRRRITRRHKSGKRNRNKEQRAADLQTSA